MNALSRLRNLQSHITPHSKALSSKSATMARLDIDSKYRMLSGYEIPVLGYGVCNETSLRTLLSKDAVELKWAAADILKTGLPNVSLKPGCM